MSIILFLGLIFLIVLGIILVTAMPSESDMHYQHVGVAALTQNAADDYTEVELNGGADANGTTPTNSGTVVNTNSLAPELALNAYGKGKHGASVWDVKEFLVGWNTTPPNVAGTIVTLDWALSSDGATRTSPVLPHEDAFVEGDSRVVNNTSAAAGTTTTGVNSKIQRYPQPQQMIGGHEFHNILTKAKYRFGIDGSNDTGAKTARLGMKARRVIVPLTEVFFDRGTISGLLDAVVLESILN